MANNEKKRHILKDMRVSEVSLVPKGANPGALQAILKAAPADEEGVLKQSFNEALTELALEAQMEQLMEMVWKMSRALRMSVQSILSDPAVAEKKAAIRESLAQFSAAFTAVFEGSAVIKSAGADNTDKEGIDMDELKKTQEKVDELTARLAKAEFRANLPDAQRAHYDGLDAAGQEAFSKMEPAVRADVVKKAAEADETLTVDGATIRKSAVGEGTFLVLKAQQAKIDKAVREAEQEREARVQKELEDEAARELPHLKGTREEVAKMYKAAKGNEAQMAILKSADAAMAKAMTEAGQSGQPAVTSGPKAAGDKLQKMAEELAAKEGVTVQKAYAKVLETKEGAALYDETLKK